jgi:amidase
MVPRRSLLALAAATGLLSTLPLAGCAPPEAEAPMPPAGPPHPELEERTLAELAASLERGEVTSLALVEAYLARIEALDRRGPTLRSVLEVNPEARAIAHALDEERRTKGPRGPLHGIPILLKDNIDTGDRMHTTAGSLALAGAPALADSAVAARLRAAGVVLLGKTNLSEWANIRSTRSTSGWSAVGGLVRNPYALDRNASGSSSGSAVAVAASLCAAAIGTETDGSIVSPSSISGLVGLKPTVGLVSRRGIVPISRSQDTAGPMARTVADAALLLSALAGPDPADSATLAQPSRDPSVYTEALDRDALRGKRVGVIRVTHLAPGVLARFERSLHELRGLGATLVDPVDLGPALSVDEPELEVLLTELRTDLELYLGTRGASSPVRTLADLVRFNREHADVELAHFGQELFEDALKKGPLSDPKYLEALATCRKKTRDEGIDAALRAHTLDLLVAPTGGIAWHSDLLNGDAYTGSFSSPAAVAGYPSLTVPSGELGGLPMGILFFGAAWSEPVLLGAAFAYEQATRHRRAPRFPDTVDSSPGPAKKAPASGG